MIKVQISGPLSFGVLETGTPGGMPAGENKGDKNKSLTFNRGCVSRIYFHLYIDVDVALANGCAQADLQSFVDTIESGLARLQGKCDCDAMGVGGLGGCSFTSHVVWHSTGDPNYVKPLKVELNCKRWPGGVPFAEATPGEKIESYTTNPATNNPANLEVVLAHELGHNLFGVGGPETSYPGPPGWDGQGHDPDGGLMRNAAARGLDQQDRLSPANMCYLIAAYKLCDPKECCFMRKMANTFAQMPAILHFLHVPGNARLVAHIALPRTLLGDPYDTSDM